MSKFFLITGPTKGIGLALTQRLLAQGHQVIGIARQNTQPEFTGTIWLLFH